MAKDSRSRNWMGVVYHHDDKTHHPGMEDNSFSDALQRISKLDDFLKQVKYFIHGSEICPTSGTKHLQCFFVFKNDQSLANLRAKFTAWLGFSQTIAWKKADSNTAECIDYCSKDGKDLVEFGIRPKGKGHRSDLESVALSINAGCNMSELFDNHPASFIKFSSGLQKAVALKSIKRDWKTEVFWIHGPTGTGKSRWVFQTCDRSNLYVKDGNSKWFDGYLGEANVLFDDFRPTKELPFSYFLRLLDRYPMTVEGKGCTINFAPERIFITTPLPPMETFSHLDWIKQEDLAQLTRRISQVIHMDASTITQHALLQPFVKVLNNWDHSVGQQTRVKPVVDKTPSRNSSKTSKSRRSGSPQATQTVQAPVVLRPQIRQSQLSQQSPMNSQNEDDSSVDMASLHEISGDEEPSDAESLHSETRSVDNSQLSQNSFIASESEEEPVIMVKKKLPMTTAKTVRKRTELCKSSGKNRKMNWKEISAKERKRMFSAYSSSSDSSYDSN